MRWGSPSKAPTCEGMSVVGKWRHGVPRAPEWELWKVYGLLGCQWRAHEGYPQRCVAHSRAAGGTGLYYLCGRRHGVCLCLW